MRPSKFAQIIRLRKHQLVLIRVGVLSKIRVTRRVTYLWVGSLWRSIGIAVNVRLRLSPPVISRNVTTKA